MSTGAQRDREDSSEENSGTDTLLVLPNRRGNPFMVPRPIIPNLNDYDDDSLEGFNPFRMNFNPLRSNPLDGFLESIQGK